jgi:hypothetical protein
MTINQDRSKITLILFRAHSGLERKLWAKNIKKQPQSLPFLCWGTWIIQSTTELQEQMIPMTWAKFVVIRPFSKLASSKCFNKILWRQSASFVPPPRPGRESRMWNTLCGNCSLSNRMIGDIFLTSCPRETHRASRWFPASNVGWAHNLNKREFQNKRQTYFSNIGITTKW